MIKIVVKFQLAITTVKVIANVNCDLKEVANDVHYGDQICSDIDLDTNNETWIDSNITCSNFGEEITCLSHNETCEWIYNGQGTQFQILVGPSFIFTFATANLLFGLALDRFNRPLIMGTGVFLFSLCCMLMGVAQVKRYTLHIKE